MIESFSKEVIQQLNYYVYRLIDPRNGKTFYVGKGKGNRVFNHVRCAIDYYDDYKETSESDPNKFRIIKEITDEGLEVIHIIQRWNLSEKEAFEVEAALIDAYQGLSNLQSGHHNEYGVTNAECLQKRLSLEEYEEPTDIKYIIIKVKPQTLDDLVERFNDYRYEATRSSWKVNIKKVQNYPYAFSVTDGVVKEVYKIEAWEKVDGDNRFAFKGVVADSNIRERFVGKRIPVKYIKKGMASPVLYSRK